MADAKISALTAVVTPGAADELATNQAGVSKKITLAQVRSFVQDLVTANPAAPPADTVRMFGRKIAGKMFPAFIGPSGLDSALQASLARNKVVQWSASPGSSVITNITGMVATAVGTATVKLTAITNLYTQTKGIEFLVTVAATTAIAGWRSSHAAYWRGNAAGLGGWFFVCRYGLATGPATATTSLRSFTGFGNNAAPTDVNPSTLTNICGMGIDSGDANWQFMTNDNVGTATKIDLGASFARDNTNANKVFELAMFCAPNGSTISYEITDLGTGATATGTVTTDLPQNTVLLAQKGSASVGGVSSVVGYMLSSLYIETDL